MTRELVTTIGAGVLALACLVWVWWRLRHPRTPDGNGVK